MKFFETAQSKLAEIGYHADKRAFNNEQLAFLLKGVLANIVFGVYFFHVANTPKEFLDSVFMFSVGILVYISSISTISETATIFTLVKSSEMIVNESE